MISDKAKFYFKVLFFAVGFILFLQFLDDCKHIKTDNALLSTIAFCIVITIIYWTIYKKN